MCILALAPFFLPPLIAKSNIAGVSKGEER
jgi:hypothetical protein